MFCLVDELGVLIDLIDEFHALCVSNMTRHASSRSATFAWKLRCIQCHARDDDYMAFLKFNMFSVPYVREIVTVPKEYLNHIAAAGEMRLLGHRIQAQYCHLATQLQISQIEAERQNAILDFAFGFGATKQSEEEYRRIFVTAQSPRSV